MLTKIEEIKVDAIPESKKINKIANKVTDINGKPVLDKVERKSPFITRSLKQVKEEVGSRPPIKKLVGDLISEGEQTILFSTTNLGKSILAYQIGKSIAEGTDVVLGEDVILENECNPMTTILFDFELSDGQFIERLGNSIPNNFYYTQIDRGQLLGGDPKKVMNLLRDEAETVGAKMIIIDNISKIGSDLEKSENAKLFMDEIFRLVKHEDYNILIIAHTPKLKRGDPVTIDSLAGSSRLGQLVDNAIALGKQNEEITDGKIYIKQLKTRMSKIKYGANNVIVGGIKSDASGWVKFYADGYAMESSAILGDIITTPGYKDKIVSALAVLLYGSARKASVKLGHDTHTTVNQRNESFKSIYPDEYRQISKLEKNQLKDKIQSFIPSFIEVADIPEAEQLEIETPNLNPIGTPLTPLKDDGDELHINGYKSTYVKPFVFTKTEDGNPF